MIPPMICIDVMVSPNMTAPKKVDETGMKSE